MNEASKYEPKTRREANDRQREVVTRSGQTGVLVVTITSAVVSFVQFGVSWTTVTIASLGLLLALSVLANVVFIFDSRVRSTRAKHIAFLTPSSGGQPFYASMLNGLVRGASLALGQDYIVVPSMPTESFEAVSIWGLFASLEDRQVDIDGIIMIPDHPDRHFDELVGFHEKRGDIPLVLVDVYFDLRTCDERTRKRLPSFVGGDEQTGGSLAAEIVIDAIAGRKVGAPTIFIVNGGEAPWEQQRAISFRKRLLTTWPGASFIESPPINYSRSEAFDLIVKALRQRANKDRSIVLDAIFACNDDMAIGARGAISRVAREGYKFNDPPQIVGYDGISEIREYLDSEDPYIAGTVNVKVEEQAKAAMLLMHKLIRTGQRRSEVQLISPEAVRRS